MSEIWTTNYQWIITSVITVIGLIITYFRINKSFNNEIKKMKQTVAIEEMQKVPYKICELMDVIRFQKPTSAELNDRMSYILNTVLSYGSVNAIKLAILMQRISYKDEELIKRYTYKYTILAVYSLLIVQIKYDLTSDIAQSDAYFKLRLTDYDAEKENLSKTINDIVNDLDLNKNFKI